MSSMLLSYIFLCAISLNANTPIYFDNGEVPVSVKNGVLQGTISETKELPQELYGTWSVASVIIDTNSPGQFRNRGSDLWTLQKGNGIITLNNPETGATASITVDEVKGNTATFTRINDNDKFKEREQVKITVDNDKFYGTDSIETEYYRRGKYLYTTFVKYDVIGSKISGPAIKKIFSE